MLLVGHRMGRQSAEMGRSRSPLGDRSGPSGQPQRSAGLETTGCKGPPFAAHAEGGRRGEACAATRWANLRCKLSCQGAVGRAQPTGLSWVRGGWRCGRAGGRLPIDDRAASLRIAGLGRETVTVGPRGKGGHGEAECQALGLRCTPRIQSQRSRRFRPVDDGRARPAASRSSRMALPG